MWPDPSSSPFPSPGTRDGGSAADHDQPYRFGGRPRVGATFPFSERQYARLLVLRSRYQASHFDPLHLTVA